MKAKDKIVTPEQFVLGWQRAKTVKEASDNLGIPYSKIRARAHYYRKRGVPLKRFGGGRYSTPPLDIPALSKLVAKP